MNETESFHREEKLALVSRYATPMAAILIGAGLIFAPLDPTPRLVGAVLLAFSLLLNVFFVPCVARLADGARDKLAKSRATINLWINIVLIYLLGRAWSPIWLLLVLSSVATAIYGTRQRALVTASFLSGVVVLINLLHQLFTPEDWALVAVKAAFIFLSALMVNDLTHPRKPAA
jgi:hypothetical protein